VVVCVYVCASYSCASYSNSWAVEVIGGDAVADTLAKKHGVINLGRVSHNVTSPLFSLGYQLTGCIVA